MISWLDAWLAALDRAARGLGPMDVAPIAITIAVDGELYHLVWDGQHGRAGRGRAPHETLELSLNRASADAIRSGELNAQRAFVGGAIRARGRTDRLIDSQPLIEALADQIEVIDA